MRLEAQDEERLQVCLTQAADLLIALARYPLVWTVSCEIAQEVRVLWRAGRITESVTSNLFGPARPRSPAAVACLLGTEQRASLSSFDPRYSAWVQAARASGYRATRAVPVLLQGQPRGAIAICSYRDSALSSPRLGVWQRLARRTGCRLEL